MGQYAFSEASLEEDVLQHLVDDAAGDRVQHQVRADGTPLIALARRQAAEHLRRHLPLRNSGGQRLAAREVLADARRQRVVARIMLFADEPPEIVLVEVVVVAVLPVCVVLGFAALVAIAVLLRRRCRSSVVALVRLDRKSVV